MNGQLLAAPPYQFTVQVPSTITPGRYGLTPTGVTASGQVVDADPILIDIERPDQLQQLTTQLSELFMAYNGEVGGLIVYGQFADGSTTDLTYSSLLTYSSDTPSVATVDTNALVTAVAPGTANIIITYEGISIKVPVYVMGSAIAPSTFSLYVSEAQQFAAQMALSPDVDQSVIWSISPQLGSIDSTGLYTAPSTLSSWQGVTVTATSVADPTKSASAQVWVFPPVSVSLAPSTATLTAGNVQTFAATALNGSGNVTWSTNPATAGTVQTVQVPNPNNPFGPFPGLAIYAPAAITTPQTVTITATSVYDTTKSASAQLSLAPSVAVSVSPSSATLSALQSQQFGASINYGSNATPVWSLNPNVGTISAAGLYTAPATVTYQQTIAVIATGPDIGAGPCSGAAAVTLMPQISSSITAPTGLAATVPSNSEIDLSWTASTKSGGSIAGYNVFRNGTWVGSTAGTSFADLGLVAATPYAYTVAAYDASSNSSVQSAAFTVSTLSVVVPNLVARYTFGEGSGAVLHDSSGNGLNGAISAGAWSPSGISGAALVFDGANTNVAVPNSTLLNLTTGMTLEAWVNPAQLVPTGSWVDMIAEYGDNYWTPAYILGAEGSGPHVMADISGNYMSLAGAGPLAPHTWVHLATTYDGAALQLFVNGVQVGSQPASGPIAAGTQPLYIGCDPNWSNYRPPVNGMMDDVRIYNRALSQSEIVSDMTASGSIGISLDVISATINPLQTQQFTATVSYTGNTAVTWSLNPNIGTISGTGLYTAPATIDSLQTLQVTAASVAYPGRTAVATITLNPEPTLLSVNPPSGIQGRVVVVDLTGTNFDSETIVTASNPKVVFEEMDPHSTSTLAMPYLNIAPDAALGPTNLTVTTHGRTSNPVVFTVTPGVPWLESIDPPSGAAGNSVSVTITGTYFYPGATVAVLGWVTPNVWTVLSDVTVVSDTKVTVTLSIPAGEQPGGYYVKVTSSGGSSGGYDVFTVTAPPVSVPNAPTGPTTGVSGTQYMFTASGAVSSLGDSVQYQFNWGDGGLSFWTPKGVSSSIHVWPAPGVYVVTVQARSTTQPALVSAVSAGLTVTITGESISAPSTPSGPASGVTGTPYTFATGGAVSSLGNQVLYNLIWGDGTYSGWLPAGTTSASHTWMGPGTCTVTAQAMSAANSSVLSPVSSGAAIVVAAGETISAPAVASGPTAGAVGTSYTYTAGGAVSSTGNPVRYFFDWGDGKFSGWLGQGVTAASHAWTSAGSYAVTVYAADATNLLIQSGASGALTVQVQ